MGKNEIIFYRGSNIEIVIGRSAHSFPRHSHNAFCIGIVTYGKIRLRLKEYEYDLGKNNVYFIPPFSEHAISSFNNMQYGYAVICLHNEFVGQYRNILLNKYIYQADDEVGIRILEIYKKFCCFHDYQQMENETMQVLKNNIKPVCNSKKQQNNQIVLSMANSIKEQIEQEIDLKKISEQTYISKYHLLKLFKDQMGVTPYHFYIQEKIKKVKKGLIFGIPILDLVCTLNFSDQSHLCNTFKKHVGITPKQYKNNYIEVN